MVLVMAIVALADDGGLGLFSTGQDARVHSCCRVVINGSCANGLENDLATKTN